MHRISAKESSLLKGGIGCEELFWAIHATGLEGNDRKSARLNRKYDRKEARGVCPDRFSLIGFDPLNIL